MKKFYQIIASVALSALAIGASAQVLTGPSIPAGRAKMANNYRNHSTHNANQNQTARVQSGPMNVFIDYVDGDKVNNTPTSSQYYWLPPLYMNARYTLADTTFNVRTSNNANYQLTNYATVNYDTMWDVYTQAYQNPAISALHPTVVDTIWGYFAYHNTSTKNDTVIFEIDAVTNKGFQTNTVYGRDTVIFNASTLPNNALDSLQFAGFVINGGAGINIPATARRGWNFSISVKEYGSKLHNFGLWYFSIGTTCGTFGICNTPTVEGLVDGDKTAVNSFTNGNMWYNDVKNGGNGAAIWFPNIPPSAKAGHCAISSGAYYYDQVPAQCPPDTNYYYVQNIALFPSVSFTDVTGMNELSTNGFSVGQNYPNPYNQTTQIPFNLAKESNVVFSVYDMTGREVFNNTFSTLEAGQHTLTLDATQFKQGVYFYTFNVNGVKATRKMVITQ
jgi:hypothetical protein